MLPKEISTELVSDTYETLTALRKEHTLIDIADLTRLVDKTHKVQEQIQGKDIVLFIGDTGSGKTTTVKALLGYQMGFRTFKGMKYITIT